MFFTRRKREAMNDLVDELAGLSDPDLAKRAGELPRHPDEFTPGDVRVADEVVNRWLSQWGGVSTRK